MIELSIIKCSKSYNKNDKYSIYDTEIKSFDTIDEAKKWIKDNYPNKRKSPMHRDNIEGQLGYVIGFRNSEYHDGKTHNFLEQHWIEFRNNTPLIIKENKS